MTRRFANAGFSTVSSRAEKIAIASTMNRADTPYFAMYDMADPNHPRNRRRPRSGSSASSPNTGNRTIMMVDRNSYTRANRDTTVSRIAAGMSAINDVVTLNARFMEEPIL